MIQNQIYYHISNTIFTDTKGFVLLYPSTTSELAVVFMLSNNYSSKGSFSEMSHFKPKKQDQISKVKLPRSFGGSGEKIPLGFSVKCFIISDRT